MNVEPEDDEEHEDVQLIEDEITTIEREPSNKYSEVEREV